MDGQARAIKAALTLWFEARAPREKQILIIGGSLVVLTLIYNVFWAPAWDGCAQIRASLPGLEAQLADVQMQVDEAHRLKGMAAIHTPAGIALRDALETSLAQAGIAQPQFTVLGKGVQVDAKNAPFGAWMAWLNEVRRADHVRVVNVRATGAAQVGSATVSVTLQPASQQ